MGSAFTCYRAFTTPLPLSTLTRTHHGTAGRESEARFIVFDGDVDAVWVENMNSVMDDNRLLTLPNGERIRLQSHCGLVCETFDLQYASPATISRCGMVWVDPKNLGYRPFYERWVRLRCGDGVAVSEEVSEGFGLCSSIACRQCANAECKLRL
jgi:hypothetical protein